MVEEWTTSSLASLPLHVEVMCLSFLHVEVLCPTSRRQTDDRPLMLTPDRRKRIFLPSTKMAPNRCAKRSKKSKPKSNNNKQASKQAATNYKKQEHPTTHNKTNTSDGRRRRRQTNRYLSYYYPCRDIHSPCLPAHLQSTSKHNHERAPRRGRINVPRSSQDGIR